MSVLMIAGCSDGAPAPATFSPPAAPASAGTGPIVEVVAARTTPPLDPDADPRTPLGALRARYLPIWSPDFDWAFPPEVCGSDWALDAVAEPTSRVAAGVLGHAPSAAALAVMRYEDLLARALAEPDVDGQLCVAVATVGTARADALDLLAAFVEAGARSVGPPTPTYPGEVTVVAASPTAALAVACVTPGYPGVITSDGTVGTVGEEAPGQVRLQAYLLSVAGGLEDAVTDISYRVSEVTDRPAGGCDELDGWAAEWTSQTERWADEGELWGAVGEIITADGLCDAPPAAGPDECPRDWR